MLRLFCSRSQHYTPRLSAYLLHVNPIFILYLLCLSFIRSIFHVLKTVHMVANLWDGTQGFLAPSTRRQRQFKFYKVNVQRSQCTCETCKPVSFPPPPRSHLRELCTHHLLLSSWRFHSTLNPLFLSFSVILLTFLLYHFDNCSPT